MLARLIVSLAIAPEALLLLSPTAVDTNTALNSLPPKMVFIQMMGVSALWLRARMMGCMEKRLEMRYRAARHQRRGRERIRTCTHSCRGLTGCRNSDAIALS